jgi:hypothetical protein
MTAPVVYGDLWVAHKGARGPRLNGETAPWPSRPPIHWLRLPRVRLVMHVLNCARHRTARPKSSRHVDELLDERLAHRGRPREDTASDSQRRAVHHAATVKTRPGGVPTATGAARLMPYEHCARAQEMTVRAPLRWPRQVWTIQPASV